jgi:hypothetical protein
MEFISNIFYVISNSEAFLIVFSGVLIYTIQQLISQLWIDPVKEFKQCRAKIETLMNRWDFLHFYTEGKTSALNDAEGSMDERIKVYRKELNNVTTELIYSYNSLPLFVKRLYCMWGFDVRKAKTSLLTLSVMVAKEGDWTLTGSKSSDEINKIYAHLKLSKYLRSDF